MAKKKASVSNMTRSRVGMVGLFISACFLVLGAKFLASENLRIMEIDFSGDEDIFGWMFIVVSALTAAVALYLALKITDD